MSAMHPSLGWAFWSDNLELGTQVLGDLLDLGIIAKLSLGDAFGAVTLLWKPETQVGWLSGVISRVSLPSSWYLLIFFFLCVCCCCSVLKYIHGSHSQMTSVLQDFPKTVGFSQAASSKEIRDYCTFYCLLTLWKASSLWAGQMLQWYLHITGGFGWFGFPFEICCEFSSFR